MKKIVRIMASVLCATLMIQVPAFASDLGSAGAIGAVGAVSALGVENIYEASVIARMTGRAGASTVNGAKGISFEIIYSDIKNIFCNFKNGFKTKLSSSSIDPVADLVTTNKSGEIIQSIQCKDGTSVTQINKVVEQVSSGKYSSTELVGTKEFTALYNEKAAANGVTQTATNSGVSTKTTSKVANKALGIAPSGAQLLKTTAKNSGIAAAITGCISLAESIYRGDDIYTATGNVVEDASISAVSIAVATVASAELPVILTALGASATVASVGAAAVAFIIPVAGGYALYILADKVHFGEKVADTMESVVASITSTYHNIEAKVISFDIPGKASSAWAIVTNTGEIVKDTVWDFGQSACDTVADTVGNWISDVKSWFSKSEK